MDDFDFDEYNSGTKARRALRRAVVAASVASSWADAQLEWAVTEYDIDRYCGGECLCQQEGLKFLYTVRNIHNGRELRPVGSTCIVEHFGAVPRMLSELAQKSAVARVTLAMQEHGGFLDLKRDLSPTRIAALAAEGILDEVVADQLMTLRRRRRPMTLDQHVMTERVLREVVAPALGGDPDAEIIDNRDYPLGHKGAYLQGVSTPTDGSTSAYIIGHHDGIMLVSAA